MKNVPLKGNDLKNPPFREDLGGFHV